MKHIPCIIVAAVSLSLVSCVSDDIITPDFLSKDNNDNINAKSTIDAVMPFGANQIVANVTVSQTDSWTKSDMRTVTDTASVEVVSFHRGENPWMSGTVIGADGTPATKAIYTNNTTCQLNSNFLRLDEVIGENGAATYEWPNWGRAKVLEAEVISTPDLSDGLFYRNVTFTPTQAYNIRTYNDDKDTIFYHSRLVAWHPMILSAPRDGDKVAAVEFSNSRYANNRYNVTAETFGVVFDHALDGSVDLMMSNMVEGQRWHPKFDPTRPESDERASYNRKHYADKEQTQEEIEYNVPFGHFSRSGYDYVNPLFYHHYLAAVRLWAVVENSGETTSLNLKTWGEIEDVSFVNQPSTAIISLPNGVSSPFSMEDNPEDPNYGKYKRNSDGTYYMNMQQVQWGNVISWGDETNLNIHSDRMFGNDSNNKDNDFTVSYPVDMTKDGGVRLDKTYLGYCLVKPFENYELSETDGIHLAIRTSAGIYYATIPSIAKYVDGEGHSTTQNMFQKGQIYDVILNLRTEGSINEFIEKENDVNYINLSPYDEQNQCFLSANSYVIDIGDLRDRIEEAATDGPAGYCFTGSIMGNGERGVVSDGSVNFPTSDAVIRGATSARIVWQSSRDLISNVQLQHEYVRFIVNRAEEGNAVLAVTDASGKILWSWHIWITEDPTKNPLTVTTVPAGVGMEASTIQMMDRNLGALRSDAGSNDTELFSSFGLYYQWGRKDPLPGPIEKNTFTSLINPVYDGFSEETKNIYANSFGSGIESSIENPMNYMYCDDSPYYQYNWMQRPIDFLWGLNTGGKIQKSIYDPCPFGYRVPYEEIQLLFENATTVSETSGKGVTVTDASGTVSSFFPYAGFIGSERGQYSREPEFNYVSTKGDYSSSVICPSDMSSYYSYFSNHRLRTYIAGGTWTEENIDGQQLYTFNVPSDKYRVWASGTIPRDYTNRTSAATIRCVQDKSYVGKGYASITLPTNYRAQDVEPGKTVRLTIKGGLNIGKINASLTIQPMKGNEAYGDPDELDLIYGHDARFNLTHRSTTTVEGTFDYTYPSDFITNGITGFKFTVNVIDTDNPELVVDPATQSVSMSFAHLLVQDNSTPAPTDGSKLFLTVENGRNFTKTNEPLVGQPATLTVYVRKDLADDYKTSYGGTPIVKGTVTNEDGSNLVNVTFSQTGSTKINGLDYYEFTGNYTNDFKGATGGMKKCSISLNLGGTGAPTGAGMATLDTKIKIWGIVTTKYSDSGFNVDRFIRKGLLLMRHTRTDRYFEATSDSKLYFNTNEGIYDYSSLFHWSNRVSWSSGSLEPQGPAYVKSVKYSVAGGENRYWYMFNIDWASGTTVTLSTTPSNIYVHNTGEGRTLYSRNDAKSRWYSTKAGDFLLINNNQLKITGDMDTPVNATSTAYFEIFSVYQIKDPTAESAQYLPFSGDPNDGNFDSNYLIF